MAMVACSRHKRRSNRGFTLVEIMVSMVLTGILVAGMVGVWGMVAEQFFRLSLRQKAVFVLHGHMERLAQLYRLDSAAADAMVTTISDGSKFLKITAPAVKSLADFTSGAVGSDGFIFLALTGDRNVVWLDREKGVTAQLHWIEENLYPNCAGTTGNCQLLTLYLDYPYRFNKTTGNNPSIDPVETISVKTIVGQRQ